MVLQEHAVELSKRQLVLPDSQSARVLHVFSKFEAPDFIHTYMHGHCPGMGVGGAGTLARLSSSTGSQQVLAASGTAAAGMTWHLPRCSLEFELTADGSVVSLDHRGYRLSQEQLLVTGSATAVRYTLPEFHQYLVLQAQQDRLRGFSADRSDQLVLVPSGRVAVQRFQPGSNEQAASIHVELSQSCADTVKVGICIVLAV